MDHAADVGRFLASLRTLTIKDWLEVDRRWQGLRQASRSGKLQWGLALQGAVQAAEHAGQLTPFEIEQAVSRALESSLDKLVRDWNQEQAVMLQMQLAQATTVAAKGIAVRDQLSPSLLGALTSPFHLGNDFTARPRARGCLLALLA